MGMIGGPLYMDRGIYVGVKGRECIDVWVESRPTKEKEKFDADIARTVIPTHDPSTRVPP